MTEDINKGIPWEVVHLPNIPFYKTELSEEVMSRLWDYVDEATHNFNAQLAGNIHKSLILTDKDDWFQDNVIGPISKIAVTSENAGMWETKTHTTKSKSLVLNKFWVNFQKELEFNPIHDHSGVLSFVIWMKIPTEFEDQHQIDFCKHSNNPTASDFEFIYTDILGKIHNYPIRMGSHQEGVMVVFPATLRHQVYPFYNCDETRISISGNMAWNAFDMELFTG